MRSGVIAIDGPAGSGKTVVGQRLADVLGYRYLDTGAFYRALTWLALARGVSPADGPGLAALVQSASIQIERPGVGDGRPYTVKVNERDVTSDLTLPSVGGVVSVVSAHPEVRSALLPLQRRVASQGNTVMAGRDIGTVVCPEAVLKIYLDAPLPVRIERRIGQLHRMGRQPDAAQVAAELAERDRIDPLKPAQDAVFVDAASLTIDQELAFILDLLARRGP